MFNPFSKPMVLVSSSYGANPPVMGTGYYADSVASQPDATDYHVLPNEEVLDDANYPDSTMFGSDATLEAGVNSAFTNDDNIDDLFQNDSPTEIPAYAGSVHRLISSVPGQSDTHSFLSPAPGSTDLIEPRDSGGVSGTAYWNNNAGPVTGWAMDSYQNVRQGLLSTPPGQGGPVVGGPDQNAALAAAQFQAAFATQSNQAADDAMVTAI